jgi:hypothetical protein
MIIRIKPDKPSIKRFLPKKGGIMIYFVSLKKKMMKRRTLFLFTVGVLLSGMLLSSCNTHRRGKRRSHKGCDCPKFSELNTHTSCDATKTFG